MANYHVVRNDEGEWGPLREGAKRISNYANTQSEAELEAKRLAANSGGGEVRIHGLDGKKSDSDTG